MKKKPTEELAVKALQATIAHHQAMAKIHADAQDQTDGISPYHAHSYSEHNAAAKAHQEVLDECQKIIAGEIKKAEEIAFAAILDRNTDLVPLPRGFSAVAPDNPNRNRLVLRPGQEEITNANGPVVDAVFSKLANVED